MKKVVLIMMLIFITFSCKSRVEILEEKIYTELNSFTESALTFEENVQFVKNNYMELEYFDVKQELLKLIQSKRKELEDIQKLSIEDQKLKISVVKNKIIDEFINDYNKRLDKIKLKNPDSITNEELIEWLAKQYIIEFNLNKNELSNYISDLNKLYDQDYINILAVYGQFEKNSVNIRMKRGGVDRKFSVKELISVKPNVYYKDIKWGKSTYSGAYIVGKIVNDSYKRASGSISIPLYQANTDEYLGRATDYFYDIPGKTTYSFKVLAVFDGTAYYGTPEIEFHLESNF